MVRRLLLPLLGLALLATEAASAQTTSVVTAKPGSYARATARTGRTLTAREKRAAEAAAKAAAASAAATAAVPTPDATASASTWSGWSNEASPQVTEVGNGQHRPTTNVSVAPGMPINQVGHGVSTDYNGRPLYRTTTASTTLAPGR